MLVATCNTRRRSRFAPSAGFKGPHAPDAGFKSHPGPIAGMHSKTRPVASRRVPVRTS